MNRALALPWRERGVLWLMLAGSLLGHGGAFFLFRVTDAGDAPGLVGRSQVRAMLPGSEGADRSSVQFMMAAVFDPSLIAIPSARGFSNRMWGHALPASRQALAGEPVPAFLGAQPPGAFPELLAPVPLGTLLQGATVWGTDPEEPGSVELRPIAPAANRSVFRLTGGLIERAVVRIPSLPKIASAVALRPTHVRVAVGADGEVRYVALERSCGNEAVDAQGMELARQFRFETTGEELQWGVMRFLWATELPAVASGANGAAGGGK